MRYIRALHKKANDEQYTPFYKDPGYYKNLGILLGGGTSVLATTIASRLLAGAMTNRFYNPNASTIKKLAIDVPKFGLKWGIPIASSIAWFDLFKRHGSSIY